MPKPRVEPLDPNVVKALQDQLETPHFAVKYPIRLTAKNSYVAGRAALVVVNPHVLIPLTTLQGTGNSFLLRVKQAFDYKPSHERARVVAWFRPPEVDRNYNIDFSIVASPGSYTLESSDGTETTEISGLLVDWDKHLSTTFHANTNEWLSFSLSGTMYWSLEYCEINVLP